LRKKKAHTIDRAYMGLQSQKIPRKYRRRYKFALSVKTRAPIFHKKSQARPINPAEKRLRFWRKQGEKVAARAKEYPRKAHKPRQRGR
jgi:hypothetical protein